MFGPKVVQRLVLGRGDPSSNGPVGHVTEREAIERPVGREAGEGEEWWHISIFIVEGIFFIFSFSTDRPSSRPRGGIVAVLKTLHVPLIPSTRWLLVGNESRPAALSKKQVKVRASGGWMVLRCSSKRAER